MPVLIEIISSSIRKGYIYRNRLYLIKLGIGLQYVLLYRFCFRQQYNDVKLGQQTKLN